MGAKAVRRHSQTRLTKELAHHLSQGLVSSSSSPKERETRRNGEIIGTIPRAPILSVQKLCKIV